MPPRSFILSFSIILSFPPSCFLDTESKLMAVIFNKNISLSAPNSLRDFIIKGNKNLIKQRRVLFSIPVQQWSVRSRVIFISKDRLMRVCACGAPCWEVIEIIYNNITCVYSSWYCQDTHWRRVTCPKHPCSSVKHLNVLINLSLSLWLDTDRCWSLRSCLNMHVLTDYLFIHILAKNIDWHITTLKSRKGKHLNIVGCLDMEQLF